MHISLLPVSLLLSLVAAQSTTSSTVLSIASPAPGTATACAAEPVLEACLASTEAIATSCEATDYQCLCQKWSDVLTCFNNCPNDARQSSVLSNKSNYCADEAVYDSTTTTPISAPASGPTAAATTTSAGTGSGSNSSGAVQVASTTTSSTSSSTKTNGAGSDMAIGVGQVALGLAGVMGALL